MRSFRGTEIGGEKRAGAPTAWGNQALVAAAIGATALALVMALILLAAWQARRSVADSVGPNGNRRTSPRADTRNLEIDHYVGRTRTGPLGSRELIVEGYMTNVGSRVIAAADLRCYFTADSGDQINFDFPLVVDSNLDNLGDGPLPSMAGRNFSVRSGEFPGGFPSDITRIEVVNVRLE